MGAISPEFVSREDVSREAQTEVKVTLGTFSRTYLLWETTAPARYDYHGTLHLYGPESPERGSGETRFVLIPDVDRLVPDIDRPNWPSEPYQVGRYHSGLHGTRRAEFFDRAQVGEMLVEKLYSTTYKGGE
jgi:hypothetical protein